MKTGGLCYLAFASLRRHGMRTAALVVTVAVVIGLPLVTEAALSVYMDAVTARARATPILVGPLGGETDLLLDALYLRPDETFLFEQRALQRATRDTDVLAVPMHMRHRAAGFSLVGTGLGYFKVRGLRCAEGHLPLRLGDCLLGSEVAAATGIGAGEILLSDPEGVLDMVGSFGTRLRVTGVLASSGTADDRAVFCDVKTAWVIDGIGHGHEDVDGPAVYGEAPTAPADLEQHASVNEENIASFHFHGDPGTFPLSAAILVPADVGEGLIVRGRLATPDSGAQAIVPTQALDELFAVVLRIRGILHLLTTALGMTTLLLLVLIGFLALRLRRVELDTLAAIGVRRRAITSLIATEWLFILGAGAVSAVLVAFATQRWGAQLLKDLIISS